MADSDITWLQMKANVKTFLKMLKNDYKDKIQQDKLWERDFNTLIHKYKKYSDNHEKMKKIYRKTIKLYKKVKDKFPKSSQKNTAEQGGTGKKNVRKRVKFNEKV